LRGVHEVEQAVKTDRSTAKGEQNRR
jgi:hypothetical protein